MQDKIYINHNISIPLSELEYRFARSGGHGGQNVNKVETKVELLFDVRHSPSLTDEARRTILHHLTSKIDAEGKLRVISQESRSQWKNREAAARKLVALLQAALKPRKKRIKTKTTPAAKQKRLDDKKRRGKIKQLRQDSGM